MRYEFIWVESENIVAIYIFTFSSCNCGFWRWNQSCHHLKREDTDREEWCSRRQTKGSFWKQGMTKSWKMWEISFHIHVCNAVFISTFSFRFSRGDLPPKAIRHQKKLKGQQKASQQANWQLMVLLKARRLKRQLAVNLRQEPRPPGPTGHDQLPAFYFDTFYLPQSTELRVGNAVYVVDMMKV